MRLEKLRVRRNQVVREICISVDHSQKRPQLTTVYTLTPSHWEFDQDIERDRCDMDIESTDLIQRSDFQIHLRTV